MLDVGLQASRPIFINLQIPFSTAGNFALLILVESAVTGGNKKPKHLRRVVWSCVATLHTATAEGT
jgi:hypothetical protein